MTGIVHLGPRLSVNYSPLSPVAPLFPPLQNPNPFSDFPEPNVHLIKARLNPLPSIQNNSTKVVQFPRKEFLSQIVSLENAESSRRFHARVRPSALGGAGGNKLRSSKSNISADSEIYLKVLQSTNFRTSWVISMEKPRVKISWYSPIKGTVAWDFRPPLFSFKRTYLGPWYIS